MMMPNVTSPSATSRPSFWVPIKMFPPEVIVAIVSRLC